MNITNEIAETIAKHLNEIMGEKSTMPEVRAAWLASTREIAERYVHGGITKDEMKAEYSSRKDQLVKLIYLKLIVAA